MSMNLMFLSLNKVRISVFVLYRSDFVENTNYPECVALTHDVKQETVLETSSAYAILNLWLW